MRPITDYFRAWAEIDLDALAWNARKIRSLCPDRLWYAVVKADGYGHGAIECAQAVARYADGFCVACAEEGLTLRRAGIELPILVLGDVPPSLYACVLEHDLTCAIWRADQLAELSRVGEQKGRKARIQFALDCGMTRIGFTPDDAALRTIVCACHDPYLAPTGIFTHFSHADCDREKTERQLCRFEEFHSDLTRLGIDLPTHCAASAALLTGIDTGARSGIVLYGVSPDGLVRKEWRPVMRLCARVVRVEIVPCGTTIGYGGVFVTERASKIATLSIGYADGYPRACSDCAYVSINGRLARVAGRVCMDMTMVDVTDLPDPKVGDTAVLWGIDGLRAEDVAGRCEVSAYELISRVSARVRRIHMHKNADTV